MLLNLLLITVGVVRISKCEKLLELPPLPPLPDYIEKRFTTSTMIPPSMTEEHNQSLGLLNSSEEHYPSRMSYPGEPTDETPSDHGNHHRHPHVHWHGDRRTHANARGPEPHSDHSAATQLETGQDLTNTTQGNGDVHNHENKAGTVRQSSTADPFQEMNAAERQKLQRNTTEKISSHNSETDGRNPSDGSGTLHSCEMFLLISTLAVALCLTL